MNGQKIRITLRTDSGGSLVPHLGLPGGKRDFMELDEVHLFKRYLEFALLNAE
jgi:hypothetical protein